MTHLVARTTKSVTSSEVGGGDGATSGELVTHLVARTTKTVTSWVEGRAGGDVIRRLLAVAGPDAAPPLRRMVAGIVAGAVLQGVGFVLMVPILRRLLAGDAGGTARWLVAEVGVLAAYGVVHHRSQMAGYQTAVVVARGLFRRLGDHIATLPLGWFRADRAGTVGRLTSQGVVEVIGVPAHLVRPILTAFVSPLTVAVAMVVFDWRLALATLATAPLAAATYRWSGDLLQRSQRAADAAAAEAGGRVVEFAQSQAVLRAFGRDPQGGDLDVAFQRQRSTRRDQLFATMPGFVAFVAVLQCGFTGVLLVGTALALGGSIGTTEVVVLLVLAARYTEPMVAAADLSGALRIARNSLDRMDELLRTPALPEAPAPRPPGRAPTIEFDGVGFGYGADGDGRPVLDGLSFTVPAGTTTALVGGSGAGKTTVARLVARFADVDRGTVRVGGVDVRDLATTDLLAQVALVFQDVYLFEGSIADNVRVGRPGASTDEMMAAARLARVDEIVERLPAGWDTQVGEGGVALSGGERQRISIARAALKDAPIVLLDEATAALDIHNEIAIGDAVAALHGDHTLLVIAHRLETVVAADQIVVLEGGRAVEVGTHADLLAAGGRYAAFWDERRRSRGWRLARDGAA